MFSFQICLMRFFWCGKQTQSNDNVVIFDFCHPLMVFLSNAGKTAFVIFAAPILGVFGVSSFTKIAKSVVCTITIYVVNLIRRPILGNIQPCQSVRRVQHVVQSYGYISVFHATARNISSSATPPRQVPSKNTSARLVVNQGKEARMGDSCILHGFDYINKAVGCQP